MKKIIFCFLFLIAISTSKATHNRAGEILYKRIAPFTNVVGGVTVQVYTYSITVIKYTDDGSAIADRCVDTVYFGDGQKGVAPRINGLTSCGCGSLNPPIACGEIIVAEPGYKVKKNIYSIIHTYAGPGNYIVRSMDPNRNQGIHNIPNSVNLPFCMESLIIIYNAIGTNSSPIFSKPPTDRAIAGECFFSNMCAYDPDGDSLSYELIPCRGPNGSVPGYFYPETGASGSFNIHALSGLLTWCTPQILDEYSIAILVKEWRKNSCEGNYQMIGSVLRDRQIIVNAAQSNTVSIQAITDTCVKAGAILLRNISISSTSEIKVFGETSHFSSSPAVVNPAQINNTQTATYTWQTQCTQARKKPYDVFIVAKSPTSISKTYMQFRVTVLPPSPVLSVPIIDTGYVKLNWTALAPCLPTLTGYNIYRKIGNTPWTPAACEQGVPVTSGYVLAGTVPASTNTFTDNIYHPILNGTNAQYIVTAITDDCSESFADNAVAVTLLVGIKEKENLRNVSVYPNPFTKNLEIDLSGNSYDKLQISVYTLDSKLIFSMETRNALGKVNLPLSELKPGVYTLVLKTETGTFYKKIVKD